MKKCKFLAGMLVGTMVLSGLTAMAAPTYTEETIDSSRKGSITLIKQANPDGKWFEANGLSGEGIKGALPISGIEFSEIKIADIATYNEDGVIGTLYTNVSDSFLTVVDDAGVALTYDAKGKDGTCYYSAGTLQGAVTEVVQTNGQAVLEELAMTGTKMKKTSANGVTTISNLDLGMYLVAETDVSGAHVANSYLTGDDTYTRLATGDTNKKEILADGPDGDIWNNTDATGITINAKVTPYLISVPTTNTATVDGHDPGTVWMYDITSYPKNAGTGITKMVVDQDDNSTLRTYEDYEIGDTIHQVIFADVTPLIEGKTHKKFVISDTMTESLTLGNITSVKLGARNGNPTATSDFSSYTELAASDYTFVRDEKSFHIAFTSSGLQKLDKLKTASLVVVSFDATLNEKAKIGTERQNMNQPSLRWANSYENEREIEGNKIYFFTYSISLTKEGLDDPTKAVFRIQRVGKENKPDGINMQVVKETDGIYHLFDRVTDKKEDIVDKVSPNKDGELLIKGVDSRRYAIVEVATEEGHNLLKEGFDIVITAPDKGTASLKDPKKDSHRDGTVTAEVVTASGASNLLTKNGVIYITILNHFAQQLHTGGEGTGAYYFLASVLGLMGLVGAGLKIVKKRS